MRVEIALLEINNFQRDSDSNCEPQMEPPPPEYDDDINPEDENDAFEGEFLNFTRLWHFRTECVT